MSSPTAPPRRRNPVLVVLDIVASVVLLLVTLGLALLAMGYSGIFGGFMVNCGAGPYPGLQCNSIALGIAAYGLLAVAIVALLLAIGMVAVRLIQRRYAILWPLGAAVVLTLAFYLAAWVAGQTVPTT